MHSSIEPRFHYWDYHCFHGKATHKLQVFCKLQVQVTVWVFVCGVFVVVVVVVVFVLEQIKLLAVNIQDHTEEIHKIIFHVVFQSQSKNVMHSYLRTHVYNKIRPRAS